MKIYRKLKVVTAAPLPLEEIPTTYGETSVDVILTDYIIHELDEKYGFKSHLGGGNWGIAYSTFDNKVVKITTDRSEFLAAKDMMELSYKYGPFAKVFEAEEIKNGLYVISKELLIPLSTREKIMFCEFVCEYNSNTDNIPIKEYELRKDTYDKFSEYCLDVTSYPLTDTENNENIGWDNDGNLACFDPRVIN